MRDTKQTAKTLLLGSVAAGALALSATGAAAGGFEVREQSAFFQGTSFAGAAAGGSSLSSIFWNPAASSFVGNGITTDSNYSLILPETNVEAEFLGTPGGGGPFPAALGPGEDKVDIGRDAIVPASYGAYRLNDKVVLAVGMNSQYGLTTKPDNMSWSANYLAQTSKIFSLNINPSVSYQVNPWLSVGVGLQVQYFEVKTLRTSLYNGNDADDIGVGATAGINITPFRGTSIGLGYRSRIDHDLKGDFDAAPGVPLPSGNLSLNLDTPDKVTLSMRQDLSPRMRVFGTVEWTNWSVLDDVPINLPAPLAGAALNANWEDGWLYALGAEYDHSPKLTLRAGVAYEESPIQDDTSRLVQLPDNDRIWASVGATYKWSDTTKINIAYSHVWVDDGDIEREALLPGGGSFSGVAEDNGADIVSVGLTMQLGSLGDLFGRSHEPVPLK